MSENEENAKTKVSPLRAIKDKCLDCCCGQKEEVRLCPATACPLWEFRLGRNPNRKKRELTEEQKQAVRERLAKARLNRSKGD